MIACLFDIANKFIRTMTIEDQGSLEDQRKDKLRRQNLRRQDILDRIEKKLINLRLWAENHSTLA